MAVHSPAEGQSSGCHGLHGAGAYRHGQKVSQPGTTVAQSPESGGQPAASAVDVHGVTHHKIRGSVSQVLSACDAELNSNHMHRPSGQCAQTRPRCPCLTCHHCLLPCSVHVDDIMPCPGRTERLSGAHLQSSCNSRFCASHVNNKVGPWLSSQFRNSGAQRAQRVGRNM